MSFLVSKPFKGQWYYEIQIGPVVLMWQHDTHLIKPRRGRIGRLLIWTDSAWKRHMLVKPRWMRR